MAKVKIYIDPIGNTLNMWWGNPQDASTSDEVDEITRNDVLIKDKNGTPIGVEIIGLLPKDLNISELAKKFNISATEPILLSSENSNKSILSEI